MTSMTPRPHRPRRTPCLRPLLPRLAPLALALLLPHTPLQAQDGQSPSPGAARRSGGLVANTPVGAALLGAVHP